MEAFDYEKEVIKKVEENKIYLTCFQTVLGNQQLSLKTIRRHYDRVATYLNVFLTYYDILSIEKGCYEISAFLGDWIIRKSGGICASELKGYAASIKKFYRCMVQHGYVETKDYEYLCRIIKEEMDTWLAHLEAYDNLSFEY